MNVCQTTTEIRINPGLFFHPQVQTPHLIHPAQVLWAFADSMLGLSPPYQGVYLFCSQENINIEEIWDCILALFTITLAE